MSAYPQFFLTLLENKMFWESKWIFFLSRGYSDTSWLSTGAALFKDIYGSCDFSWLIYFISGGILFMAH